MKLRTDHSFTVSETTKEDDITLYLMVEITLSCTNQLTVFLVQYLLHWESVLAEGVGVHDELVAWELVVVAAAVTYIEQYFLHLQNHKHLLNSITHHSHSKPSKLVTVCVSNWTGWVAHVTTWNIALWCQNQRKYSFFSGCSNSMWNLISLKQWLQFSLPWSETMTVNARVEIKKNAPP